MQPYLSGVTLNTFVIQNLTSRYINLTAGTTVLKSGEGYLFGVTINTQTAGKLKLWDDTSSTAPATPIFNTLTFQINEREVNFNGVRFGTGCVAVVSGTADITIAFA